MTTTSCGNEHPPLEAYAGTIRSLLLREPLCVATIQLKTIQVKQFSCDNHAFILTPRMGQSDRKAERRPIHSLTMSDNQLEFEGAHGLLPGTSKMEPSLASRTTKL